MTRMIVSYRRLHGVENGVVAAGCSLLILFPVAESLFRFLGISGLTGSTDYVRHLTLWIGMMGAMIAAREKKHLSLHEGFNFSHETVGRVIRGITAAVTVAVSGAIAAAGFQFVHSESASATQIAGWMPQWLAMVILPVGFGCIGLRFLMQSSEHWKDRCAVMLSALLLILLAYHFTSMTGVHLLLGIILVSAAGVAGSPIFAVIGGLALFLFISSGVSIAAIPVEAYRIVASPVLPSVPLFTLAGYILAEGGASRRFVRLFRAFLGWMPGGAAMAAVFVCTFFTTFTGASGVTILALGGLLLPVLLQNGFTQKFSIGLLTASGSLGLLFPPCLPVIFYGVVSHVPIDKLFRAGILPGILLLAVMCLYGVWQGRKVRDRSVAFDRREAMEALWESKWEVLLPMIVLVGIFGGYTTLVEASAITALYAFITQCLIYRDVDIRHGLIPVFVKAAALVGGIMIILSVAMGMTNFLVDAQVPLKAAEWVRSAIHSRILFLLILNLFLLVVGCLMDIFSAIMVVVPLILPMAEIFQINPLHLGIIFLSNLELGYLTPPVGINLFLSAFRFEQPVTRVYRDTFPFLVILLLAVLLITYLPTDVILFLVR